MVDYSRFDHIGSDSDEDDGGRKVFDRGERQAMANPSSVNFSPEKSVGDASSAPSGSLPQPTLVSASKKGKEGRIKFEYEGKAERNRRCPLVLSVGVCVLSILNDRGTAVWMSTSSAPYNVESR